jgi:toluene monooxygenase system protein A
MYNGEISPPSPENILKYMGIGVISEGGHDAHHYAWASADQEIHATAAE